MKYLCIALIKFYRKFLSPLKKGGCCRFVPTCSQYAIEAFQKRGFFVGLILTVWRILRCNPYHPGGYDPVPETGLRYKGSRVIPVDIDDDTQEKDRCDCHGHHSDPRRGDDGEGGGQAVCGEMTASQKERKEDGEKDSDRSFASIDRKENNQ